MRFAEELTGLSGIPGIVWLKPGGFENLEGFSAAVQDGLTWSVSVEISDSKRVKKGKRNAVSICTSLLDSSCPV